MSDARARQQLLDRAFLEPAVFRVGGVRYRNVSIMSLHVARALDLSVLLRNDVADLAPDEFARQMVVLACVQASEPDEVLDIVSRDPHAFEAVAADWAASADVASDRVSAELTRMLTRFVLQADAAAFYVDHHRDEWGDEPPDLMEPGRVATQIWNIASRTGWSERFVAWELPLVRAMQYDLCAARAAGLWTFPLSDRPAASSAAPAVVDLETSLEEEEGLSPPVSIYEKK